MKGLRLGFGAVVLALLVLHGCGLLPHRGAGSPEPIDLNRAPARAVERLPGITPSMAARIVAGRPYEDAHALVERGILTPHDFERIADLVVVPDRGSKP